MSNYLISLVYYAECDTNSRGKPKRGGTAIEKEPHPYTISFFTFPTGAAGKLLAPKRESKRANEGIEIFIIKLGGVKVSGSCSATYVFATFATCAMSSMQHLFQND